jgi:uncharacterized protein with PIN domain/sulfur carrier protein ThiS
MARATFRFYEELNDFLAPPLRRHEFEHRCADSATAKHAIEALGVPHTEVELVLVNGTSVGLEHRLRDGDRVAVYPKFETFDVTPLLRVRAEPLRVTRFVADAHLGGLARLLRMTGFDTLFDNGFDDDEVEALALAEGRVVLTRDRELLKRRRITHGCYVHALPPTEQLRELFDRLDLAASARPFTRCLVCNAPLRAVDKAQVAASLPQSVRDRHQRFSRCERCLRVYWEGSHWQRMRSMIDGLGCQPVGWRSD